MKRTIPVAALLLLTAGAPAVEETDLTISQEYYVGRTVAAQTLKRYPLYQDVKHPLYDYVNKVGTAVALESDRPIPFKGYHFIVLESPEPNAFAAPAGFIFVTTGLLRQLKTEDELAGVLAHEIAHVNLRHPELVAQKAADTRIAKDVSEGADTAGKVAEGLGGLLGGGKKTKILRDVAKGAGYASMAAGVAGDLLKEIENGYSREKEEEADRLAVQILARPGVRYDPRGLREVLARMPAPRAGRGAFWRSGTHPAPAERVAAIDAELGKHAPLPETRAERTKFFEEATRPVR